MKAVLEKAMNVIGSYARSSQRREDEQHSDPTVRTTDEEYQPPQQVIVHQDVHSPAMSTLRSPGGGAAMEGDDVLFSKNNVLLKHPCYTSLLNQTSRTDIHNLRGSSDASLCNEMGDLGPNSLDNHVLIPGFLFVTTRGSNFGTTLILNWAPNSSMIVPQGGPIRANAQSSDSQAETDLPHSKTSMGSCPSISIDLCSMEMIRIFYRMDDSGFIISGELVVKSKEENFKVRT